MIKILFVCLGNICRSPCAEGIMQHKIQQLNLTNSISCDSAGTGNYHIGARADERMRAMAKQKNYQLESRARQFTPSLDFIFDYILAMDRANYNDIISTASSVKEKNKVYQMKDFYKKRVISEVPDPYWDGTQGFNNVINILENSCEELLQYIIKQHNL